MNLSQTKISQLEFIASKVKVNPDLLVDALLDVGLLKKKAKKSEKKSSVDKVRAIEQEALNKGWTREQLWNLNKYQRYDLHGLLYFVTDNTEIVEVAEKYIALKHSISVGKDCTVLKFYNSKVPQEWVTEVVK